MFKKHYIIFLEDSHLHPSQKTAFHMLIQDEKDFEKIRKHKEKLQQLSIKFYTHLVSTKSETTDSLIEKDSFFKDTQFFKEFDAFLTVAQSKS